MAQSDKGGLLVGKTDKDNGKGIKVLAPEGEIIMGGGEIVIAEAAATKHCEELSRINQDGGGVAIPCDAQKTANKGRFEDGGLISHLSGEHKDAYAMAERILAEESVSKNKLTILTAWKKSLLPHFNEEENKIYNIKKDTGSKHFLAEHKKFKLLIAKIINRATKENVTEFANLLKHHIKEEEVYFTKMDEPMKAKTGIKISSATTSELDKAVSDLHRVEKTQKMMKDANAIIRSKKNVLERLVKEAGFSETEAEKVMKGDSRGRVGFSSYSLTNNNANLKRLQQRVKMLQSKVEGAKAASTSGVQKYTFENGFFEINYAADRVQIYFEDRPTDAQKNDLKRNGWHWSYTNKAWQRKITPQAIRNAEYLMKATKIENDAKEEVKIVEETVTAPTEIERLKKELANAERLMAKPSFTGDVTKEINKLKQKISELEGSEKEEPFFTEIGSDGYDSRKPKSDYELEKERQLAAGEIKDDSQGISLYHLAKSIEKPKLKLTKAVEISNDIISFCEQSDLPKPERELSNNGRTVYLNWHEEKIEAIIDADSPVADGIFLKHKGKMVDNYKLSQIREVLLKIKELLRPETAEALEPNTPEDFDEAIIAKIEPQPGWAGNIVKEGNIRRQILAQLQGDDEQEKLIEAQRIFALFKTRMVSKNPDRITHNYKNQYELNKAIEALLLERDSSAHDRYTSDEKNWIRKYSGYGGLDKYGTTGKGGLFEYYTPKDVIEKMWALAYKYGYNNGPVLEPSVATGEFLQFAKPETRVVGYEISLYSSIICKILYPTAEIHLQAFEEHFIKNNWTMKDKIDSLEKFDLVIGNPPYGDFSIVASRYMTGMGEKDHTKAKNYVEYFIRRGLDLLNPGGLLIYIVGAQLKNGGNLFLDSGPTPVKEYLAQNSELLDAYRLPDSIFERTGVTSDIIVLRKN